MEEKQEKVVIIGSGPAGLTAAIYTARGNLSPLVVAGRTPGGQPMLTTDVDDYPGFPQGVQGPELMGYFRSQAERFGARFLSEDAVTVDFSKYPFEIETENSKVLTEAVIVASGASPMWLGLPSEQRLIGRGVSVCATCDGPFFKDKEIIIVGGGDTAMREAQHLSKYAKLVTIVHRRETFRAQDALQELVKSKPNIKFLFNSVVEEVLGDEKVTGVKLKNTVSGEVSEMSIDGIFIAIGYKPNTDIFQGKLELDERGYIVLKDETRSSVEGVFVAGDAADYRYRQVIVAGGSGAKAALDVEEYLDKIKN
ncbi:MAG: thioredoxin-disulfide reductase [bacterium]|nr:thioredoxin-disulfide reductase [bacterium]